MQLATNKIPSWEETFRRWSKPPSETEQDRAQRAANMVSEAIKAWPALARRGVVVYPTGSVWNNTNIRGQSDSDVAVVCDESFFYDAQDLAFGVVGAIAPPTYDWLSFRRDAEAALRSRFPETLQVRDKSFHVPENTYRMKVDVTPFFVYRRSYRSDQGLLVCDEGVRSISRSGVVFTNWHRDHYAQGVARNAQTGKRFKRIVRVLKNLKCDMLEHGNQLQRAAAEPMASFLLESLVFNASDAGLDPNRSYYDNMHNVIAELRHATKLGFPMPELWEVNRRKRLFGEGQAWTQLEVNVFLKAAWNYVGFGA